MTPLLRIMRPRLPSAERLLPYLRRIDSSRTYSNFGPLSNQLERRLAAHFGVPDDAVTTVANGTLGLALALSAQDPRAGTLCVMPAWTFIASAQAAALAGLVPYFVDVDPLTWALDARAVNDIIERAPGEVGAVMPVAPFGQPIDFAAWDRFRSSTGLPVVIDAAAGFDSLTPTRTPAVVSMHATKVFGIGEGGVVICDDPSLIRRIRARANFGFDGRREAFVPSLNAKMSEYHAAVGNAALDEWSSTRAEWMAVAARYRERLTPSGALRLQDGFGESWVSSVCVVKLAGWVEGHLEHRLRNAGIETRRWWGDGAHAHRSTLHLPRTDLPVTAHLAKSTIAVPIFPDMQAAEVDRVADWFLTSHRYGRTSSYVFGPRVGQPLPTLTVDRTVDPDCGLRLPTDD
jgi:dTDP-4-amino-4,6-dideoxygalactose transaminase